MSANKSVTIWNKKIVLDNGLADKYESLGNSLDVAECRYLAKTGGDINPDSSPEDIKHAIETGIRHTISLEHDLPKLFKSRPRPALVCKKPV